MTNTPEPRIAWLVSSAGFSLDERRRREREITALAPAGVSIELMTPPGSPEFLSAAGDFAPATTSTAALAASLDPARYPVAVLAGAVDPGLDEIRAGAAVPVVGPFAATLQIAALLGKRVSVISSDPLIADATRAKLASKHPDAAIASVRDIGISVEQIFGLMSDPAALEDVRGRIVEQGLAAVKEDGADALQLGTMTFATLGVTQRLRDLGVPVLDPARIAVGMAALVMASMVGSGAEATA